MSGHAKRLFCKNLQLLTSQLQPQLKEFVDILPWGFSDTDFIEKFRFSHPYQYQILNSKYKYYSKEDIRLKKRGKKARYEVCTPDKFISFIIKDNIDKVRTTKEQKSYYTLEQSKYIVKTLSKIELRYLYYW